MDEADEVRVLAIRAQADRKQRREPAAVLAPCFDFAADADDMSLASREITLDMGIVDSRVGSGHENADVAAEHLAGRVAEQELGRAIEDLDVAAVVDDDNTVHCGVE